MADDLPDWLGLTLFKAVDGDGNLVTVLVDASGAMFAVMKGEYSDALHTVKLDAEHRMIARTIGSIDDTVETRWDGNADGNNYNYDSDAVPTGKLWQLTNIAAVDNTRDISVIRLFKRVSPYNYAFYEYRPTLTGDFCFWQGGVWLKAGQKIRVYFAGSQDGDALQVHILGAEIDAE